MNMITLYLSDAKLRTFLVHGEFLYLMFGILGSCLLFHLSAGGKSCLEFLALLLRCAMRFTIPIQQLSIYLILLVMNGIKLDTGISLADI